MVTTSSNCSRNFSVKVAKLVMKKRPYFLVNSWKRAQCPEGGTRLQSRRREDMGSQQERQDQNHVLIVSKVTGI